MVNELIEACRVSAKGYEVAAEKVKEPHLRQVFLNISRERRQFAEQFEAKTDRARVEPSTSSAVRKEWEGLQSVVPVAHDLAVLDEVERAEDATLKIYQEAQERDLPSDVRALVEEQYWEVRKDHDRMRSLRDSHWRMEVPMAGLE